MHPSNANLVYRVTGLRRAMWLVFGSAFALAGLAGLMYWGSGHDVPGPDARAMLAVMALGIIALGLATVASVLRGRVTLSADAIEYRGILSTRRMRIDDIAGYRFFQSPHGRELLLQPKPAGIQRFDVPLAFVLDDAFLGWLSQLVDLSAREADEKLQRVREDIALGNSPEERTGRVARAHRLARWLSFAAIGVVLWAMSYPVPYSLAIGAAALIPWIALSMYWSDRAAYSILDEEPKSARVNLIAPVLVAGFALILRAVMDVSLVDWTAIIIPTVIGTILLVFAAGGARGKLSDTLIAASLLAAYPAGVLALGNVYFDNAAPRLAVATVDATRRSDGKETTFHAQLSPWIDAPSSEVAIAEDFYRGLVRGDQVCVRVHPGALGFKWFEVERAERCGKGPAQ